MTTPNDQREGGGGVLLGPRQHNCVGFRFKMSGKREQLLWFDS